MTRRTVLAAGAAAAAFAASDTPSAIVQQNDAGVEKYLKEQVTSGRWTGGVPDATGLCHAGSAAGLAAVLTASFVHPESKYHRDAELMRRIRLAAKFLEASQSPDGNISLLTTNFNSPPDTGFVVWSAAEAASIARKHKAVEIEQSLEPFLRKAARGMSKGGVHTPNHRWVVSSAMSQIHGLYPDDALLRRIDQWLAEGIDIDGDGQFTERSTTIYNAVTDRSLTTIALKLHRPALLDPVRKNLEAMLYLRHGDGEVVTEISRRQDLNERGTMDRYWFPLRTLAVLDRDGRYAALVRQAEPKTASLSTLLDYPEVAGALPASAPLPETFERVFPDIGIARIRRGPLSASILLDGTSRFFTVRRGDLVIDAVRFASAFFGKGQFVPAEHSKDGSSWVLRQKLEAGYYQPLDPPERVAAGQWGSVRRKRKVSELCRLEQSAAITETAKGFRLRLQAKGTEGVPLSVEIGLREGTQFHGGEALPGGNRLGSGAVVCSRGKDKVRIGPGIAEHRYVQVRGSQSALPGPSVYMTGFTPFDHTVEVEFG